MDNIPKYVFDKEYATQWRREIQFLENKGISYTYAKKHPKYPIITYKYTKTPELFLALAEFYNQVRIDKFFKDAEAATRAIDEQNEKLPIEKGCIEVPASELTKPEKALMGIHEEDVMAVLDDTE